MGGLYLKGGVLYGVDRHSLEVIETFKYLCELYVPANLWVLCAGTLWTGIF